MSETPTLRLPPDKRIQVPTENNSILHEAAGNLAFLLSVVRCGESLSEAEESNVRRVIEALNEQYRLTKIRNGGELIKGQRPALSEAIKELRKVCGLSQANFGREVDNVTLNTVQRWEAGKNTPFPSSLVALYQLALDNKRRDLADVFGSVRVIPE